jgi:quercetin dioxygenase-like cupin family protein
MSLPYLYLADLATEVEIPKDGILSKTLHGDDHVKVVIFGFDAGQELSEHTASMPALLFFASGEADLTLGSDAKEARPGTWVHMQPNLTHSVRARTPVVMLLVLLKA